VRQIKLATHHIFGAQKYWLSHRIVVNVQWLCAPDCTIMYRLYNMVYSWLCECNEP